ncbi:START domain-containing protein [Pseudoalteromonas tunicata]|uniref:START domain-containing protein n=1 Tax=Pseudoalteromonas tunicata TaxID=314281 RepID=UPI00273D2412|nr:START domain-containing protein [Pseudoalteromonas tunicata]MDP4984067.1 START domain-containing protein [Pseudoalteromonas tunicata]
MSLMCAALCAEPATWQWVSSKQEVDLYKQETESGLIRIKAHTVSTGTISAFIALLHDTEHASLWIDRAVKVEVLAQPSETEFIVYTEFSAPWPLKNRDMLTYSNYQSQTDGSFEFDITDQHILLEQYQQQLKSDNTIRIKDVRAHWQVKALTDTTIEIEYQAFADPDGAAPNWLVNKMVLKSAQNTFVNMRARLQ